MLKPFRRGVGSRKRLWDKARPPRAPGAATSLFPFHETGRPTRETAPWNADPGAADSYSRTPAGSTASASPTARAEASMALPAKRVTTAA